MKQALFLTIFLISHIGSGQSFTARQTKEDLNILIKSLETYNPALNIYNPSFKDEAAKIMNEIPPNLDKFGYLQLVSRVAALSNEGHIGIGNWEDSFHEGFLNNSYKYLPLVVTVLEGRVYAWTDLSNEEVIQRGDEILSINGRLINDIVMEITEHIQTDGHITSSSYYKLTSGFNWMYYLYIEQSEQFDISYKSKAADELAEATLPAITRQQMLDNLKSKTADKEKPAEHSGPDEVYEFEIDKGVGYLTLRSFNRQRIEKHKIKAKKLYKTIYKQLKEEKVSNLVIDLRDNNGGRYEFAFEMLPFIMKEQESSWYKTSVSWEGKEKEYKFPRKDKYSFNGNIWVLVNGGTFSTASSLARYLREYTRATIVGEEGGGRYEGYAAGSQQYVNLPNSNLRVTIPRYLNNFPVSTVQNTANRGILPDYEVVYIIEDLINEKDVVMNKVKELISEGD